MTFEQTRQCSPRELPLNYHKETEPSEKVTMPVIKLQYKKMTKRAYSPTRGSALASGIDLKSAYAYTVPKRGTCLVKTDIQLKLPQNTYGRIAPRSGLALHKKIDVGAGVVDEDYTGNVCVILFNHGDEDFVITPGDKIAQIICTRIEYPILEQISCLDKTGRDSRGFGSTGLQ